MSRVCELTRKKGPRRQQRKPRQEPHTSPVPCQNLNDVIPQSEALAVVSVPHLGSCFCALLITAVFGQVHGEGKGQPKVCPSSALKS